jgi:hypothetical protein
MHISTISKSFRRLLTPSKIISYLHINTAKDVSVLADIWRSQIRDLNHVNSLPNNSKKGSPPYTSQRVLNTSPIVISSVASLIDLITFKQYFEKNNGNLDIK